MSFDTLCELVYTYVWEFTTEHECLPTRRALGLALDLTEDEVRAAIGALRKQSRLSQTTLYPTAYTAWWRANVRVFTPRLTIAPLVPRKRRVG